MLERLSFGSNAFTDGSWTFEGVIYVLAGCGYAGVNFLADAPLFWPLELSSGRRKSILGALKKTGLVISGINGFTAAGHYGERDAPPGQDFGPSFADSDPDLRAHKVAYTKRVIDIANQLEVGNISISSGYPPEGVDPKEAWQWMMGAMKEALDYAHIKGVNLNIESEPKLLVANSEDSYLLLMEMGHPNLGVHIDIGHLFVCGENVVQQIFRHQGKINGADIEDIGLDRKGKPVHYHLVPGEGVMPLGDIFRTFQKIGFENRSLYTVELYSQSHRPVEAARESMAYLQKLEEKLQREG